MVGLGATDCWCRVGSEVVLLEKGCGKSSGALTTIACREACVMPKPMLKLKHGNGVPRTITSIFQAQACKGIHQLADCTPSLKHIGYVIATGAVQVWWLAVHCGPYRSGGTPSHELRFLTCLPFAEICAYSCLNTISIFFGIPVAKLVLFVQGVTHALWGYEVATTLQESKE